jgi:anaerobic nitric oxide reductase transcription regulator
VRELEHLLSRASLKAIREQGRASKIISIDSHHLDLQEVPVRDEPLVILTDPAGKSQGAINFRDSVDQFQRQLIEEQLQRHEGKLAAVARALQLDRSNLVRAIKRLGI